MVIFVLSVSRSNTFGSEQDVCSLLVLDIYDPERNVPHDFIDF